MESRDSSWVVKRNTYRWVCRLGSARNRGLTYCTELFNILINPEEHDFALRWHRDDVRETASESEEVEALARSHHGVSYYLHFVNSVADIMMQVQWNT